MSKPTILIYLDGNVFRGRTEVDTTAEEAAKEFYAVLNKVTSMHTVLDDGSHLLLNEAAIKRAVFRVSD